MTIQEVYIEKYDWLVTICYNLNPHNEDNLLFLASCLDKLGCDCTEEIINSISTCGINCGLTYSSPYYKESILVVGLTYNPSQFQNTFDHEKGHLAMHIAETFDINLYGEEFQYLTGKIGELLYEEAKKYICDCQE